MSATERIQHVTNMRVAQAGLHKGDTRWFITTANGFVVSPGYEERDMAEAELEWRRAATLAEIEEEDV